MILLKRIEQMGTDAVIKYIILKNTRIKHWKNFNRNQGQDKNVHYHYIYYYCC